MPTYLAYLNIPREQGNPGAGGAAEGGAGGGRLETAQEICGVSVLQGFFSKFGLAETRFYVFEFKYLLFIPGNVPYASFFLRSRVNLLRNRDCS